MTQPHDVVLGHGYVEIYDPKVAFLSGDEVERDEIIEFDAPIYIGKIQDAYIRGVAGRFGVAKSSTRIHLGPNVGQKITTLKTATARPVLRGRSIADLALPDSTARQEPVVVVLRVRERRAWFGLLVLALTWGVLSGMSFVRSDFWLSPVVAVFGCLSTIGLAFTIINVRREWQAADDRRGPE